MTQTFIGKKNFKEDLNGDVACSYLNNFNLRENQGETDQDEDGWKVNLMEPYGFMQDSQTSPATSMVSCATMSSRSDTAAGYGFKINDKIKVKQGYKIRASGSDLESLFAADSQLEEMTILEEANGSFTMAGGALMASVVAITTMISF